MKTPNRIAYAVVALIVCLSASVAGAASTQTIKEGAPNVKQQCDQRAFCQAGCKKGKICSPENDRDCDAVLKCIDTCNQLTPDCVTP